MPRRATPPPPGGRRSGPDPRKSRSKGQLRGSKAAKPATKKAGLDIGKFASEVSGNFARGVAEVGRGVGQVGRNLDRALPSRGASSTVPGALKNAPSNRVGLRKAGWGK